MYDTGDFVEKDAKQSCIIDRYYVKLIYLKLLGRCHLMTPAR